MIAKKSLASGFAAFQETWSPRVAGDINDMYVKLAKLEGAFVWHSHDEEDELFLVVSGRLRMEFRGAPARRRRAVRGRAARAEDRAQHRQCRQRKNSQASKASIASPQGKARCLPRMARSRNTLIWP